MSATGIFISTYYARPAPGLTGFLQGIWRLLHAQMALTFGLVVLGWVFFRAETISQAWSYITGIFSLSLFKMPMFLEKSTALYLVLFMIIEWVGRNDQYAIEKLGLTWKKPVRRILYYAITVAIIFLYGQKQEFIYFQF